MLLASSLQTAVQELAKTEGSSITGWRWGQLHRARFWSVISRAPVIGSWFSTSVPVGGGEYTIDAEYVQFADQQHPYQADIGPGLRMILDFSDLSNSRFLIAPGMSENPFSPHYGDLTRRWKNFDYMTPAHEAARHTLTLVR
jgi:penicillin amidase